MPEQISKYPDVTIAVLKGLGARCGEGVEQKILTTCPAERFCSLPTGEICVYGIADIPKMTQIKPGDLAKVVCPPGKGTSAGLTTIGGPEVALFGATFLLGLFAGRLWRKFSV
jgi:hypothetical protein